MKNKIPNIVTILILTTLTAIMCIYLSGYRAVVVKPSLVVPDEISKPLVPFLDQDIIRDIQNRNE